MRDVESDEKTENYYLQEIAKNLNIIFSCDSEHIYTWLYSPNKEFDNNSPLVHMYKNNLGLVAVHNYLAIVAHFGFGNS